MELKVEYHSLNVDRSRIHSRIHTMELRDVACGADLQRLIVKVF